MQEKVTIQFEDIDNVEETLKTLYLLFQTLLDRYAQKEDESMEIFLFSITKFFALILHMLGTINIDDLNHGEDLSDEI